MASATRVATVGILGAVALGGCGLQVLGSGGSGPDEGEREVRARSGAFTVHVPKDYRDVDIAGRPDTIEVAVQRADPEQIIVSRYDGAGVAEKEALFVVTGNVTQFGLACAPLKDTLGGEKAWSCTGEDEGQSMEKAIVATEGDGEGAVVLVQGAEGEAQGLAREVVESLSWE